MLALFLGLIVSAGLYFAYLWPQVEPLEEPAADAGDSRAEVVEPPAPAPVAAAADDDAAPDDAAPDDAPPEPTDPTEDVAASADDAADGTAATDERASSSS